MLKETERLYIAIIIVIIHIYYKYIVLYNIIIQYILYLFKQGRVGIWENGDIQKKKKNKQNTLSHIKISQKKRRKIIICIIYNVKLNY